MDLSLSSDDIAFEREIKQFFEIHFAPATRRALQMSTDVYPDLELLRDWYLALYERGWAAPNWPREFGGTGWSPMQRYLYAKACAQADVPKPTSGVNMLGPLLIRFGTQAQKAFYLPRILSGEDYWCQGYSEPGSGSDLASLQTRADRDGEHYVVNGTKIWTTHAHYANKMFALVRTQPQGSGKRQEGISFLLIDMDSPGVSVRPIHTISGDHEVNQVFLDDVRVPVDHLVGEEGQGWSYGKYLLEFERGGSIWSPRLRHELAGILKAIEQGPRRADVARAELLQRASVISVDLDALEMLELEVLNEQLKGKSPGSAAPILKLRFSQLKQQVCTLGLDAAGMEAMAWLGQRPFYEDPHFELVSPHYVTRSSAYLSSRAFTIFAGSSEVQHEILAKQMLNL
jgi:acyl-CoA dehydrogenase